MIRTTARWIVVAVFIWGLLPLAGGCVSASSTKTYQGGPPPSSKTLKHVKPGDTTREWVVATLGTPACATRPSQNVEILKYSYTQTQKDRFSVPLIVSAREEKTIQKDLFFEITNGRVSKYWQEGQASKTESSLD